MGSGDAATAYKDPAARGLDVFLHMPERAAPGGILSVQAQVYGFPTVTSLTPLPGAVLEAVWDPESLGKNAPSVASVQAVADKAGRVHLEVPVPEGDARELQLLIGIQSGEHRRTRSVKVARVRPYDVSVYISDTRVVPGTLVPAWVLVRNATTQTPTPRAPVELTLLEGGVVRHTVQLTTDQAGSATGRIAIPLIDEPVWKWTLRARVPGIKESDSGEDQLTLSPREETPGQPHVSARWNDSSVLAGQKTSFWAKVYDATGEPVASHPVKYWTGLRGQNPPADVAKWEKTATTDRFGRFEIPMDAPTTVSPIVGTEMRFIIKTTVDGRDLEASETLTVGLPTPSINLLSNNRALVPGLEQRLLIQALDGFYKPVKATFSVKGHGLDTEVTSNADGEAEILWKVPADIGTARSVGPCAGGVAATLTVRPKGTVEAFGKRTSPYELCVSVDREANAVVLVEPPVARAGDKVRVKVVGGKGLPWSIAMQSNHDAMSSGGWMEDGEQGADVLLPANASGVWTVTAVSPGNKKKARKAQTAVLAIPKILPSLGAKLAGGRPVPGGSVLVDVDMTDGHGHGLPGTVAAVVFDMYGGGSAYGLVSMDTRRSLCSAVSVEEKRCDTFLEGDSSLDASRRGRLSDLTSATVNAMLDPAADVDDALTKAFADVVHSLEGAVMESTESPERLRDTRAKTAKGWDFNPELWTLVTSAMDKAPETPGGEPFALVDAVAIDPQVTFDNVARRVTRLKLLRVLVEVRNHIREHYTDPNEPALRDPGAILRRIVREGKLADHALLDPWGGTMQFVRANGPGLPFLTVKGMELHAPGPDGKIGTADDVRDPFERVLRSGSPYALASSEDRVVDGKLDMEVAESTVAAWQSLLEEFTGTKLGHGAGTGTGQGFGSGHGRLGSSHRTKPPMVRMGATSVVRGEAVWLQPVRTDANGHVQISAPLGDLDTTYGVALIGIPDQARPATYLLEVPASLPLSARIESGDQWTEGDEGEVLVALRNRSDAAVRASVASTVGGVAVMARPADASKVVDIPAKGTASTTVRVKAPRAGEATLQLKVSAPGVGNDAVQETWKVGLAGEPTDVTEVVWVDGEQDISLSGDPAWSRPAGPATLVLERGFEPSVLAAFEALDPDRMRTPEGMSDSLEVAARVHRWALARGGEKDRTAVRAAEVVRRAAGRIKVYDSAKLPRAGWKDVDVRARVAGTLLKEDALPKPSACPPEGVPTLATALEYLDSEPAPVGGAVPACWDSFLTTASDLVMKSGDPVSYARAILAMAERPHRVHVAGALADRLREVVALRPSGMISLPSRAARDRTARSLVYAALARAVDLGKASAAPRARLLAWLGAQRDAQGGYGSSLATRSAVRAFLSATSDSAAPTRVTVQVGEQSRQVQVGAGLALPFPLGDKVSKARIKTDGQGVIARLLRKDVRPWSRVPGEIASPVQLDVTWPTDARSGKTSRVRVVLRHSVGRATSIDARIPLPPGTRLADRVEGMRQVQGALLLRWSANESDLPHVVEVPIRFGMAGQFTVPEAHARLAWEEAARAIAPARPLKVEP